MRKKSGFWVSLLLLVLVLVTVAVSGCGKDETTIKTPEGEVTVSEQGGEVTVKTEEGEGIYKVGQKPPSEEELGVPIHPKAKYDPEAGSGMATYKGAEGAGSYIVAYYSVDAGFDDVVSWYKQKLGDPMGTFVTDVKQAAWYMQDGDTTVTVMIQEDKGKVTLTISKASSQ